MAFGNIAVDTGSFAQPDTSRGLLANFMLMQQLKNSQLEQQRFQSEQDKEQRIQQAMSGFDPANPESGLAAIYQANPEMGAKVHASIADRRKSEAEAQKVGFEAQRAGLEAQGAQAAVPQEFKTGLAKQFGSFWHGMPPNQRDPRLADRWLDSKIQEAQQMYPQWAPAVEAIRSNPDWINHARSLTPDPYEADQREVSKYQQQRQFDNQLPPTPYQREQIGLDQQRLGQSAQQQNLARQTQLTEQQRNESRWLIDKHDAAPETITYKRVLPKANAVLAAIKSKDPQSDVDIIYGLTNILDDMGSVREGDVGTIKGASSYAQWVDNLKSELKSEGKLGPKSREGIANIIGRRMHEYETSYKAHRTNLDAMANKSGLNPDELFAGPMAFGGQGGQQPAQQPAQQGGMSAPSGFSAPAPTDYLARARDALTKNPALRPRIIEWARKHGVDPSQL
jgi:hypothetical protein